ncbi:MAG TPA: hypothetical protein PLU75_04165 [Oscillospiraceae bacterium]|jgi:hypothetical protein|nr:hypothetical protein [Oscillospiraceae bacterium]HRW56717.1 hypothetical protein [Oscillospiraceae bacterium]
MKKPFRMLMLLAAAVFAGLSLSACSSFTTDTESLMSPPKLTEEQSLLHSALREVVGEDYHLKYPKADGDANSAFIFRDLDKDGEDEAMVFYSADSAENDTRMNILKKTDGVWYSVYEVSTSSADVSSVDFAKTAENSEVVLIGWKISSGDEIGVYRFDGLSIETLYTGKCDAYRVVDLDADGWNEIMVFTGSSSGRYQARMLYEESDTIELTNSVRISCPASSFLKVTEGKLTENRRALFVDSQVSEGVYTSEALIYEADTLSRLIPSVKEEGGKGITVVDEIVLERTLRYSAVLCGDIDGDGLIEIPCAYSAQVVTTSTEETSGETTEEIPEETSEATSEDQEEVRPEAGEANPICYMKYEGEGFAVCWVGVANARNGWAFTFPDDWVGAVTVEPYSAYNEWRFLAPEDAGGYEILRIRASDAGEYQDRFEESYTLVAESGGVNYYMSVTADSGAEYYLPLDACIRQFRLIDW